MAEIHLAMGERDRARETSRRALFYEFVPVFFDIQYREDLIDVVEALYGHVYDEDASVSVAQHEVESLLAEGSMTSLRLVATFCWHHSHDELEARAFRGLEQQSLRATPLLRALFQNSNATCTARSAARALARAKAPGTFEMLVEALPSDTRATWAVDIAGAMDELGDPRAVPVLIRALQREARDEPRELQNEDEKMASFLGSLNQHGSEQARMRAALALGAFDTPDSIQALEAGLEEEVVGLGCTAALYRLEGDGDLLQQLEASLNVSDAPHSGMIATYLEDRVGTEVARAAAVRIRGD